MKSESDRPITLEDLLRLKRAERPPAEFWTTFDRELRAKQLAALVEKRPWWQRMPKVVPSLFRYRIALGAGAAAVIALMALRTDRDTPVVAAETGNSVETASMVEIAPSASVVVAANDTPVTEPISNIAPQSPVEAVVIPTAAELTVVARAAALASETKVETVAETSSPSALVIAANLAGIRRAESDTSRSLLVANTAFEARPASSRTAVEPLQQMTPPSESRRSRLLTAMVSIASSESSYRTTERAASRIDEERLYDQIQRFGARGDRVNLKF